jgi:lysozyme
VATIIDLSSNNGSVDWHRLKHAGVDGAMLKASEGVTWNDPTFNQRRKDAQTANLHVGAYHYARPHENDPVMEANHFCNIVGHLAPGDILPALDLEEGSGSPDFFYWIVKFNHRVEQKLGRYPLFYSYPAYIAQLKLARPVGSGLWLASYGRDDGKDYGAVVPAPWKRWLMHQFTSNATVGGVPGHADLSHASSLAPLLAGGPGV